jgi:hypothetical protein
MFQREAIQTTDKANTALLSYNSALKEGDGREAYNLLIEQMALQAQVEALQATLTDNNGADNAILTLATIFTISALKTAARGHVVKGKDGQAVKGFMDKNGKFIKDKNGDTAQMTPANLLALRILQKGIYDDSGIMDDLRQETAIKLWEAIASGRATIGETTDDNGVTIPTFDLADTENDNTTMRDIFNVVQAYLYSNLQRHYKREYRPTIDDNGNEDVIMVTAAMREHERSIEYIGHDELFQSLTAVLNERETAILWVKCEKKQVERKAYTARNGEKIKAYVSRYKTVVEISMETGYSIKEVRNSLQKIADKLRAICSEHGKVARVRSCNVRVDGLQWVFTSNTPINKTVYDTSKEAQAIADYCASCTAICTAEHNSGMVCSYYGKGKKQ